MGFREAYEFYMQRREEAYRPLREDYFFKRFVAFIEWRAEA